MFQQARKRRRQHFPGPARVMPTRPYTDLSSPPTHTPRLRCHPYARKSASKAVLRAVLVKEKNVLKFLIFLILFFALFYVLPDFPDFFYPNIIA